MVRGGFWVILSLALLLYAWRLGIPSTPVFDEVYYIKAAKALLAGKSDPNWVHPPLAKVFIATSIWAFGEDPWAWRLPAVLASVLGICFFYLLSLELFQSQKGAFTASLLYLWDGLTYIQSRLAMLDIFMVGFLLPSLYFFLRRNYFLCSIFLGLSLACKWIGLLAFPFIFFFLLSEFDFKTTLRISVRLFVLTLLIYLLAVSLFTDPRIVSDLSFGKKIQVERSIMLRQWNGIKFHMRPQMEHPYAAPWWKWLLLIRPIWYEYQEKEETVRGIIALPNPLIWWPSLVASLFLLFRFKDRVARFIFLGGICFILPWALSTRGGFLYYLLPASSFLILALAYWVKKNWKGQIAIIILSFAGFCLFYPIYSYIPISKAWFHKLIWMKSWI